MFDFLEILVINNPKCIIEQRNIEFIDLFQNNKQKSQINFLYENNWKQNILNFFYEKFNILFTIIFPIHKIKSELISFTNEQIIVIQKNKNLNSPNENNLKVNFSQFNLDMVEIKKDGQYILNSSKMLDKNKINFYILFCLNKANLNKFDSSEVFKHKKFKYKLAIKKYEKRVKKDKKLKHYVTVLDVISHKKILSKNIYNRWLKHLINVKPQIFFTKPDIVFKTYFTCFLKNINNNKFNLALLKTNYLITYRKLALKKFGRLKNLTSKYLLYKYKIIKKLNKSNKFFNFKVTNKLKPLFNDYQFFFNYYFLLKNNSNEYNKFFNWYVKFYYNSVFSLFLEKSQNINLKVILFNKYLLALEKNSTNNIIKYDLLINQIKKFKNQLNFCYKNNLDVPLLLERLKKEKLGFNISFLI